MSNTIYLLKNKKTGEEELISAPSKHRAFSFAAQSTYEEAKIAPQTDLVRLSLAGVKVQEVPQE